MPKKLDNCVSEVQKRGFEKNKAYAICSKATGWVRKKGGGWRKKTTNYKETNLQEATEKINNILKELVEFTFAPREQNKVRKPYVYLTLDITSLDKIWRVLKKIGIPLMPIQKAHITIINSKGPSLSTVKHYRNILPTSLEISGFRILGKGTTDSPYVLALEVYHPKLFMIRKKLIVEDKLRPRDNWEFLPHLSLNYDLGRIFPGIKKMTPKKRKTIESILNKLLNDLPKTIKVQDIKMEESKT